MTNKRAAVFTAGIVLCLVLLLGGGVYFWQEKHTENLTPYEKTLSETTSPYLWMELKLSNVAYLLDDDFEVTTENLPQVFRDFFAAPSRLYFYHDFAGYNEIIYYKCDRQESNAAFAAACENAHFTADTQENYSRAEKKQTTSYKGIDKTCQAFYFSNDIGNANFIVDGNNTYLRLWLPGRENHFQIAADLSPALTAAMKQVLPYAMEAPTIEIE